MMNLRASLFAAAIFFCVLSGTAQPIPDQIDANLAGSAVSGNSWTALVENKDGSVIYYERNSTTGLTPASNTKIFTSSAAFGLLQTNYSFQTLIYYNGTLAGGTLTGDLNLVCQHDITWNSDVFSNPRAPLDYITTRVKALGVTNITGNVQCYGCCFYNLSSTDASNHDSSNQLGYNASAATNFVAALQAQGISVVGIPKGQTGFTPPGTLLYTYNSTNLTYSGKPLRLDVACIPMMKVSHNVMADALCRHLGWKFGGTDSFAVGALQVLRWVTNSAHIATNGMVMNDGCGLSHGNKFSAKQIVSMNRFMMGAFPSWGTCLPISCVDGTISSRMCGTDSTGQIHAKTGSLSDTIALSGYVSNKYDNQIYLFSFIGNKTSIDQANTRLAIDDSVVLFSARGVPISPRLQFVKSKPAGTSLKVQWSDEKFVRTGYRLYSSADGVNFGAPVNLGSTVQTYTDSALTPGMKRYYKITVVGTGGESKASRIYGAQVGSLPQVLIVDGNDRWQFQPSDNPNCTNHGFCALAGQDISGPAFDTADHRAVTNSLIALTNYQAVVWLCGEQSTADLTFDSNEESLLTTYLSAGGNLFASGSEIGYYLDRASGPSAADRAFYHNQLHAVYVADSATTYSFTPNAAGIFSGDTSGGFDNGTHGTYNVVYPDVIATTNGSAAAIGYFGGTGGNAAVQWAGSGPGGKVVNFGFPFETITSSTVRDAYMSDILLYFGVIPPPILLPPVFNPGAPSVTLNWTASAGLKYRLQYKTNLDDSAWQTLTPDVTATNTICSKTDVSLGEAQQRFYRVVLLN